MKALKEKMSPSTLRKETKVIMKSVYAGIGQVMALVCGFISILLLIVSISSTAWLTAENYRQGLWEECSGSSQDTMKCNKNGETAWIVACAVLCIISMILCIVGTVIVGIGLATKNPNTKFTYYKASMSIFFLAVVLMIISLIVFPAMFMREIKSRNKDYWEFAWAYGVAWGAAIFEFGAGILLLIDRESEEIYYKEKVVYNEETDA